LKNLLFGEYPMQHLAWFLGLKGARDAEKMYEVTLLSRDHGSNREKEFP
jgi:hypothetical protein